MSVFIQIVKLLSLVTVIRCEVTPIVLWHGMGDTCCSPDSLGPVFWGLFDRNTEKL